MKQINLLVISLTMFIACKKNNDPPAGGAGSEPPQEIKPQVDPPLAGSIGFFMDDWQPKTFTIPSFTETTIPAASSGTVTIDYSNVVTKVSRSLFGNNANTWMTQMVTEPALINHLKNLKPNIIRFPGGSISDIFFWNRNAADPPADAPATLLNAAGASNPSGYWFGKNTAGWTLSVDNYYAMLQQTGSQGIITINYGYARYGTGPNPVAAAAHLAADWVRYDNGRTKYWEIGNENFGDWEAGYRINKASNQDGQPEFLTGQLYGQHFKIFADSMRKAATEIGKTIRIGAVMIESETPVWATPTQSTWNAGLLGAINNSPDFHVAHSYYTPYNANSNAADILYSATTETKKNIEFISKAIQTAGATAKPVVLDEWNIFAAGSKQQVSHINGLHADLVIGELLQNKYGLACRWDLANAWENGNDHGMFNNGDEPDGVPKWNPRPVFYHMYFFQQFLGDRLVTSGTGASTEIASYASSFSSGELGVVLINKSTSDKIMELDIKNFRAGKRFYWYTLSGAGDNGEFSRKVLVNGVTATHASGGPENYTSIKANAANTDKGIRIRIPSRSAVFLCVDKP
ncbi:alpha-L-arabinofuranosidase [Terrimonas sp. NA20]|uniref:Alpha-L-arabinofuranosidase n=1 Tax=Terrimonas ginsenosidimutans TaxID=2908004 RepID=A0ABS9KPZ3_9BACT|nr:alpha-L-arabinofuranosidase [Terrimonas ginsenosidimutans]MCG2614387.1 alpha-L-arabinofuranosidase [Terrimonas ginsenosidimutans]